MTQIANPLRQFFRQPAIYLTLPTRGEFWHPDAISMPENKELPVLPMTAVDEITYRTPDALFNGQAVVSVIQSCIPSIKNAWAVPSVDVDAILVAIRIASYGHDMEFDTKCPACSEESERRLDLRQVLDSLKSTDYSKPVVEGDVEIYFKPMNYKNLTDNNRAQYEEQRILQQLPTTGADTEALRATNYADIIKKITDISVKAIASSIAAIKGPAGTVTEP
jgi:hypothetical protein